MRRTILTAAASAVVLGGLVTGSAGAASHGHARAAQAPAVTELRLTPSSAELAKCMPHAKVKITSVSTTEELGFDKFRVRVRHLPPNTAFTVFLLQNASGPDFGAAEYIGDVFTDEDGDGATTIKTIIDEAFASTIVDGKRVRVDLNQVGMWFADPAADDFCLGPNSPVTPFDGDDEAGVQAFNSANTRPLPAP
jgi:hypothetical protein